MWSSLVQVPRGVCAAQLGCGAMLLWVELYERSSHLFGSLLEGNACSGRPPLLVCICRS